MGFGMCIQNRGLRGSGLEGPIQDTVLDWIPYPQGTEHWLHGFTSHLKVQTCSRQGTVVAGLTPVRQLSSGTTLSLPWTNWTQDTVL